MTIRFGRAIVALALTLGMAAPAGAASISSEQQKLQEAQQHLQQDRSRLAALQHQHESAAQELSLVEGELRSQEIVLTTNEGALSRTQEQYGRTKLAYHHTRIRLDEDRQALSNTLRAVDEAGTGGLLNVLLSAQSFSDFVSRLDLVRQLVAYDFRVIHAVAASEATLNREAAQMAVDVSRAHALVAEDQLSVRHIQSEQAQAASLVGVLANKVSQQESAMHQDEANTTAIQNLLQAMESGHNNGSGLKDIHFIWPVAGPITSPFGWRLDPVMHKWWLHSGVDIGASYGAPIHAAASGTVLLAQWITGYGYTVVLDHGNGVTTLYAHTERFLVKPGDHVSQGQEIALVGATGWATGPHCHFEIRLDGKPLNPIGYLPPHS